MIPLVAPHITYHDKRALVDSVMNNAVFDDAEIRLFEEEFAEYVGCAGAVAVNSGTNALAVVLTALGRSDEAIWLPSFTCRAVLDAALYQSGSPELVDNRCDVANADFGVNVPDWGSAGIVTHMFGIANEIPASLPPHVDIVEDITLSLGAIQGPYIAVCSFHRDKMISTGRGGMIVAQDQAFLERCRELAYYDTQTNGYTPAFSFGMTAMQAALGRSQLRQLPGFIERRREIALRYTEAFTAAGIECPGLDTGSVFFRYIIAVTDPAEKVVELARLGIECGRGVNPPLHRLLGLPNEQFPGAEKCFATLLSVPVHPGLTDEQVGYITEQVVGVCAA